MFLKIGETNINYKRYGNKNGESIVYLHGWGQNIEMMQPVADPFQEDFDLIILDLPGHGLSDEPKTVWSVYEYTDFVHHLLKELNVSNPIVVGHSFGGKIALLYAAKYECSKLILFAPTFRKEIQKLSFKTKMLKSVKKVPGLKGLEEFAKKHIGSTDYKNASPMMRNILVGHVNADICEDIKNIKCPTLLIWGDLDDQVSIEAAQKLENLIPDAGLVIYENATHYAYLERIGQTINVMRSFLGR